MPTLRLSPPSPSPDGSLLIPICLGVAAVRVRKLQLITVFPQAMEAATTRAGRKTAAPIS